MTASDVAARFNAKPSGAGWIARCPTHDDSTPSLSIAQGDKGGVVVTCRAGCATPDVLAAGALTMSDLQPPDSPMTKATIAATYDYRDEGGALLYQVVRLDPKSFRQRRPDGNGWIWSLGAARRVLYNLPALQGTTTAYIVEGEKDVDRLRGLGLPATCNSGGAGKWKPEYMRQLVAATVENVVILPDNDDPGRAHAEDVARSCHAAGLKVKIVTLPNVPPKGDVSDWLDAGHTRDDLAAIVKAAPLYVPSLGKIASEPAPAVKVARAPVVTFLNTVEPEHVDWIWPGRLARGKYTLLAGEPGLGKTFLLLDASARISRGGTFPDGAAAPRGRVLILTAEDGLSDTIRPRLDALGADTSQIAVLEAVKEPDGTRSAISLVRDLDMLKAAVAQVRPDFVWVDPFSAYLGRTDTHRDSEVRAALAPLLDMGSQERFALAGICHLSKDAQKAALHRPGGSIAFVAAARIVLALAADPNDPARRLLASIKSNICRPAPTLAYQIVNDTIAWESDAVAMNAEDIFRQSNPTDREERTDAERVILDLLDDTAAWPMAAKDAIDAGNAHGIAERTMRWTAKKVGIRISRAGFGASGKWLWYRPELIPAKPSLEHRDVAAIAAIAAMQNPSEKEEEDLKSVHRGNVASVLEKPRRVAATNEDGGTDDVRF